MNRMYVVTHKKSDFIPKKREFIGVGGKKIENVCIYDNTLFNISDKNPYYCELTALYWIWKNEKIDGFVSFEHYRRFFCSKSSVFKFKPISEKYIEKKLKKYDIIVSNKFKFKTTIYEYYKKNHIISDLDQCRSIIANFYPEYLKSFDEVMKSKQTFMCNMFVMSKKLLDEYCEWLFGIFDKLEKHISLDGRDNYQKRVYGFLSERLFNVWVNYNKFKYTCCPIFMPTDKPFLIYIKRIAKKVLRK